MDVTVFIRLAPVRGVTRDPQYVVWLQVFAETRQGDNIAEFGGGSFRGVPPRAATCRGWVRRRGTRAAHRLRVRNGRRSFGGSNRGGDMRAGARCFLGVRVALVA